MDTVIFIDSNIYLDFYRIRKDAQTSLIVHLDGIRDHIVVTNQVEMEFKKHRQSEMIASINALKTGDAAPIPPLVAEHKSAEAYKKALKSASEKLNRLKMTITNALEKPSTHDEVYRTAQRIFRSVDSPLCLHRESKVKNQIRRKAFRRFIAGYPPRKKSDTSMGDAINWEWLVHVCGERNCNALVVSRDGDYGVNHQGKAYINDWLGAEFSDRVNRQKRVVLYDSLSAALRVMKVKITESEESQEREMIERSEYRKRRQFVKSLRDEDRDWLGILYSDSELRTLPLEELQRAMRMEMPKTEPLFPVD